MIKNFAHKGLEKFYTTGNKAGIQAIHAERLTLILASLNKAKRIQDMASPSLDLHPLKGKRAGCWAVTVQANWRVVFRFEDGDATVVDYLDYH